MGSCRTSSGHNARVMGPRIGVDVGGTFTDVVVHDGESVHVAKVPSTPGDQTAGVLDGVAAANVPLPDAGRFVHGTTVATNAVVERRGARVVLLVTKGFRDLLEIGRQNRPKLYDLFADRPEPLVPRDLVVEVDERVAADGSVLRPLSDDEVQRVASAVRVLRPEAVAICLLFSFLRPEHEQRLEGALDDVPVSRSSAVSPVFREFERASTTTLNAYVTPVTRRYLQSLSERLRGEGLTVPVEVMRSSGGTFSADVAGRLAVHTLLSGPAAGAWGAATVAAAAGHRNAVAFDMGGTSTDATLITAGRPRATAEGSIGGLPFGVPSTDIHTVGAGGGSIAWRDSGGSLRVGLRSAGADPGPACYGRGGEEPTVTDAYAALGWLAADDRLAGSLGLDIAAAEKAVGELARSLDVSTVECAEGIVRVLEANVLRAVRVVSVERGVDPRGLALVPFGGAGALHQGAVAEGLGSPVVLVPPNAGVLSALGLLATAPAVDVVLTRMLDAAEATAEELERGWADLERDALASLREQGASALTVTRAADCRYRGQAFELAVMADGPGPSDLVESFHRAHLTRYGYAQRGEPVEIVNLRVRAEAGAPPPPLAEVERGRGASSARVHDRRIRVRGSDPTASVYSRDLLGAGDAFDGPALVTAVDSTCLVLPGQRAHVDDHGNLVIR